jgi:hypothetical protein
MNFWRTRAAWLAALTLSVQVGVIAAASTALCCGPTVSATTDDEMACCKESGGAPHVCPIKKKPKPGIPTMTSCCDVDQQALAALFGLVGIPEAPYVALSLHLVDARVQTVTPQLLALIRPPDSPPPRA